MARAKRGVSRTWPIRFHTTLCCAVPGLHITSWSDVHPAEKFLTTKAKDMDSCHAFVCLLESVICRLREQYQATNQPPKPNETVPSPDTPAEPTAISVNASGHQSKPRAQPLKNKPVATSHSRLSSCYQCLPDSPIVLLYQRNKEKA